MLRTLPFLALIVLLLDSCNVTGAEVNTLVEADGSGQVELGLGYLPDEDNEAGIECTPEADAPPGSSTFIEQRGAETWCVMRAPFDNVPGLRTLDSGLLKEALLVHCLAFEDERLIYDLEIITGDQASGNDEGGAVYWRVSVSGEVVSTNADSVEGSLLTWTITDLSAPLRFSINAQEGAVCPASAVRLLLNLNEDGSGRPACGHR